MQTRITARHFEAPDGLRSHVTRSLRRLERYFDRARDAHVVLTEGGLPVADKRAEIAITASHQTFMSAWAADNHEAAVDGAVRLLRRQAVRHKERRRRRRGAMPEVLAE
jgi:ribosomal subunit interface protein